MTKKFHKFDVDEAKLDKIVGAARHYVATIGPIDPPGCYTGGKDCPYFVASGQTPGNAQQCVFSNSSGPYGCPVMKVA